MIPLINHDSQGSGEQWGRNIIYLDYYIQLWLEYITNHY